MYEKHLLKLEMCETSMCEALDAVCGDTRQKVFTVLQLAVRLRYPNTSHGAHCIDGMRLRGVASCTLALASV